MRTATRRPAVAALAALVALACLAARPGAAVEPGEMLDDAALEARARAIGRELRCLVCQNQSIDESDAALARDLRVLVRERLVAGESDDEIVAFVVERYGDFVLLKPPFKAATWLLWGAPALALAAAGAVVLVRLRRRAGDPVSGPPLDAEEARRLEALPPDGETRGSPPP